MNEQIKNERKKLLVSIEKILEGPMIFLGFIWLVLLVVEFIWGLSKAMEYASLSIWIIFIFDFLLKLLLAPEKLHFLKKNWLTIISLIIPALRVFRVFRVFRLLRTLKGIRLVRVVSSVNRSMKSLRATMQRRAFGYVSALSILVTFAGAAGMYGLEHPHPGFSNFGMALWWTAMRIITAGSDYWPATPEGRGLAFLISLFGYGIFGYVTATLATFFIGRDAEDRRSPIAGATDINQLQKEIRSLTQAIHEMKSKDPI
ncbi:MAG: ion transporter [Chitinophagaceae bacterium]